MNFEQETNQLKDTSIVIAEIRRRQAGVQKIQAKGLAVHEQRMSHVELYLSEI